MPIVAIVEDHDKMYQDMIDSGTKPIIINDLPCTTESDKEHIKELTITQLSSDTLATVPTCGGSCNATRGRIYLGTTCPACGNVVRTSIEESSRSLLWIRAPKGVKRMISPIAMRMLSGYFSKGSYDAISWLIDPAYSNTSRVPAEILKLEARNHTRDLNYFTERFDNILEDLIDIFPEKPKRSYTELRGWIEKFRHCLFPKHLPLPSKNLFIADKTILGIYMEESIQESLDTIYHFVSIDKDFYDQSPRVILNRTARGLSRQAAFYNKYIGSNMQPKPGHMRRQQYGARNVWSGRSVIVSQTGDHKYDEVGLPWRVVVPLFQHHLAGKLMRRGMMVNEALDHIFRNVANYDPLIHELLDECFAEAPSGRGPSVIVHRNPTLQGGSMQRFFAYFKTDPTDPCISLSILTVTAPNADFDGKPLPSLNSFNCW